MSVCDYSVEDLMAVSLSRLIRNGERIFFGLASPLPMVAVLLARELHAPDLTVFNIPGGVSPPLKELPRSTVDPSIARGACSFTTLADLFDISARGLLDTIFLRGAQVDRRGRLNNSAIGDYSRPKVRLPGGAGGAFLLPTARRAIIWVTKHDARTLVDEVEFATASGNARWLVTPLAVFERRGEYFSLKSVHPGVTPEELRQNTGFDLALEAEPEITPPPTEEELEALGRVDPKEYRKLEFRV